MRKPAAILSLLMTLPLFSCEGSKSNGTSTSSTTTSTQATVVDSGPTQIELKDAKGEWRDAAVVKFEIPYRFTSGSPSRVYQCRIDFPKEGGGGVKPMEAWELKQEGVIKTGIPVNGKTVTEFSVSVYEADAHDKPYHLVSNKVSGEVPAPPMPPADASTEQKPATTSN